MAHIKENDFGTFELYSESGQLIGRSSHPSVLRDYLLEHPENLWDTEEDSILARGLGVKLFS